MQHIENLRELVRSMKRVLYYSTIFPAICVAVMLAVSLIPSILTLEHSGGMILKDFFVELFSDFSYLLALGMQGSLIYFIWRQLPDKLEAMNRKLIHRYDRIRRMEKRLQKAEVDWETMENVSEFQLRRKAAAEVAWIRHAVWMTLLGVGITCVLMLIRAGVTGTVSGALEGFLAIDALYGFVLLYVMHHSQHFIDETNLLEVTVFEQEKRIRSLEIKFHTNNIDLNEIIQ